MYLAIAIIKWNEVKSYNNVLAIAIMNWNEVK